MAPEQMFPFVSVFYVSQAPTHMLVLMSLSLEAQIHRQKATPGNKVYVANIHSTRNHHRSPGKHVVHRKVVWRLNVFWFCTLQGVIYVRQGWSVGVLVSPVKLTLNNDYAMNFKTIPN